MMGRKWAEELPQSAGATSRVAVWLPCQGGPGKAGEVDEEAREMEGLILIHRGTGSPVGDRHRLDLDGYGCSMSIPRCNRRSKEKSRDMWKHTIKTWVSLVLARHLPDRYSVQHLAPARGSAELEHVEVASSFLFPPVSLPAMTDSLTQPRPRTSLA